MIFWTLEKKLVNHFERTANRQDQVGLRILAFSQSMIQEVSQIACNTLSWSAPQGLRRSTLQEQRANDLGLLKLNNRAKVGEPLPAKTQPGCGSKNTSILSTQKVRVLICSLFSHRSITSALVFFSSNSSFRGFHIPFSGPTFHKLCFRRAKEFNIREAQSKRIPDLPSSDNEP